MKNCLPLPKRVHKKIKRVGDMNELLKYLLDMKAFLDARNRRFRVQSDVAGRIRLGCLL